MGLWDNLRAVAIAGMLVAVLFIILWWVGPPDKISGPVWGILGSLFTAVVGGLAAAIIVSRKDKEK